MSYISLINAFEWWLESGYLPASAQLLFYKLLKVCNRAGWAEWVVVDNHRLMAEAQLSSEKSLIKYRDMLIENKLIEYQKGKKGKPGRYKICTVNFTVQKEVQMTVKKTVQMTVQTTAIYRDRIRYRNSVIYKINNLISLSRAREDLSENQQIVLQVLEDTLTELLIEGKKDIFDSIAPDDVELIKITDDITMPVNYFKAILEKKYGGNNGEIKNN